MTTRRVPPDVEDIIVARTQAGERAETLAKELNLSTRTIERVRTRRGCPGKTGRPRTWNQEAYEVAEGLLEDGCSYRDVEETTGIPKTTLRQLFPGKGFTPEESGMVGTALARLPEDIRFTLVRKNRLRLGVSDVACNILGGERR